MKAGGDMEKVTAFTARASRDGPWFPAFTPEFPEGNGQGLTEEEALESLRESILLLMEDHREDATAMTGLNGCEARLRCSLRYKIYRGDEVIEDRDDHRFELFTTGVPELDDSTGIERFICNGRGLWIYPDALQRLRGKTLAFAENDDLQSPDQHRSSRILIARSINGPSSHLHVPDRGF